MSTANDKFVKDLQDLFSKALEINTQYIREGTRLANQLSSNQIREKKVDFLHPEILTHAVTTLAKLNLDYYKNILDIGLSLANQIVSTPGEQQNEREVNNPAFTLTADCVAGGHVTQQFVLDNFKEEEVFCQLESSPFIAEADGSETQEIIPEFDPQSFTLNPKEAKPITITVKTSSKTIPGQYASNVKVVGFEPAFFVMALNVSPQVKKTRHASQKKH